MLYYFLPPSGLSGRPVNIPLGCSKRASCTSFAPCLREAVAAVGYIAPLLHYHCSYMVNPIKGFLILIVLLKQRQTNFQSDNLLGLLEIRYYRLKRPVLFCGPVVFAI